MGSSVSSKYSQKISSLLEKTNLKLQDIQVSIRKDTRNDAVSSVVVQAILISIVQPWNHGMQ